jgi:hypothetical protein
MNPFALKEPYRLHVQHLHQGNSTKSQRKGHPYVTVATVRKYLSSSDDYDVVARATARCSRSDSPKREIGYSLAVGRVMRKLFNEGV